MTLSISRKLGAGMLLAMFIAAAAGGYAHYRLLLTEEQQKVRKIGIVWGPLIEEGIAQSMNDRTSGVLREILNALAVDEPVKRVYLAGVGGTPGRIADDGEAVPLRWSQPLRNRRFCQECHASSSDRVGAAVIEFSRADMRRRAREHISGEVLLLLGSILFIALMMFVLVDVVILRRLDLLRRGLRLFRKGNTEVRIPVKQRDEIAELGKSFNELAESVAGSQCELTEYTDELLSLAVASNLVSAVSRTEDVYDAICRIAIEELELTMAWIGLADRNTYRVVPVAQRGFEDGYLSTIRVTWDDSPLGFGPTGMAIKTKLPQVVHDLATDSAYAVWREEAAKRGYRSSVALPLLSTEGEVLGALNLYSGRQGYFTKKRLRMFVIFANQAATAVENRSLAERAEKKAAELANQVKVISRSHQEWALTFDSITDLISIHGRDHRIIKANRAFASYFGLEVKDVINRKCFELFHDMSCPIGKCPAGQSLAAARSVEREIQDPRTNRTFRISTYPYYTPDGEHAGTVHIASDVTEIREKELRLIMSERLAALGQMSSGIAHEINNPLASIGGCAEALLLRVRSGRYERALFEDYLHIIEEEIMRCKSITSGMLSFVRKRTYDRGPVMVNELLDKTIEIIGYQGRLRQVRVARNFAQDLPTVHASEGELRQVFIAIIINALDALRDDGTITVGTETADGKVVVSLADNGPGISADHLSRIFDPFFTTKSDSGGTGLGLSIAHKIVLNHGGTIDVDSAQNRGTVFRIALPVDCQSQSVISDF